MKNPNTSDSILEEWTKKRRHTSGDTGTFTREVMNRIADLESEERVSTHGAPQWQRLALTAVCGAVGVGKALILLHLSI